MLNSEAICLELLSELDVFEVHVIGYAALMVHRVGSVF